MALSEHLQFPSVTTYLLCFSLCFMGLYYVAFIPKDTADNETFGYTMLLMYRFKETAKGGELSGEFWIFNFIHVLLSCFLEMIQGMSYWLLMGLINVAISILYFLNFIIKLNENYPSRRLSVQQIGNDIVVLEEIYGPVNEETKTYGFRLLEKLTGDRNNDFALVT